MNNTFDVKNTTIDCLIECDFGDLDFEGFGDGGDDNGEDLPSQLQENLQKLICLTLNTAHNRRSIYKDILSANSPSVPNKPLGVVIACVDNDESQSLNLSYRGKDKPTNVLSFKSDFFDEMADFPDDLIDQLESLPLGDLVICLPVLLAEATTQSKSPLAHFYHLVVHGTLHLLGYDHEISEHDSAVMEELEVEILADFGIDNPYEDGDNLC